MNTTSIILNNLSIGYPAKKGQHIVASNLNASLNAGELTCLLGPNGIGKSTLLRTLSAFQSPLEGEVTILGKPLSQLNSKELSKTIGVVLTEKPSIENISVRELVALGRSPYTGFWGVCNDDDMRIVDESLALGGISQLSHRRASTLSDGERQKVMVAKALAQQTPIIFLDEPTAFLDFPSKVETMQLLRRLTRQTGKTIFMSTHDVELALQVADTIWLMQKGVLTIGKPKELADNGELGHFLEHEGIVFDKETMTIQINDNV